MKEPNCKSCGETDPTKFYASIKTYCKEHWKERVRANRRDNLAHYQEFERKRANRPDRVQPESATREARQARLLVTQLSGAIWRETRSSAMPAKQ